MVTKEEYEKLTDKETSIVEDEFIEGFMEYHNSPEHIINLIRNYDNK